MMKSDLSTTLFSRTQKAVLSLLFTGTGASYHLREIVRRSGLGQGTIQRELRRLTEAGILRRVRQGRQAFYSADPDCPIYTELMGLVRKTMGLTEFLGQALRPLDDRIRLAFIYGSFARGEQNSRSDVDVMIIGSVRLRELTPVLNPVQEKTGREINPTVYSPDEYRRKIKEGHHFLTSLASEPKIFLIGDENELTGLA